MTTPKSERIEPRWPVALGLLILLVLVAFLPDHYRIVPRWGPYLLSTPALLAMPAARLSADHARWLRVERVVLIATAVILLALTMAKLGADHCPHDPRFCCFRTQLVRAGDVLKPVQALICDDSFGDTPEERPLMHDRCILSVLIALGVAMSICPPARAQDGEPQVRVPPMTTPAPASTTELAKQIQNPIGNLYSFPFQSNTNFNVGPNRGTQEILNIQPVIPIHVNHDWNIITRTILPLVWQPSFQPAADTVPFGTGAITFSAFLSPSEPTNGWLWGVGPVVQVPTASDKSLGSPVWGAGPTAVLVYTHGPWVAGGLINNVWSMGGTSGRGGTAYNLMTVQPFVNYNFGEGWYVGTSPVITANWLAAGGDTWTVPVGGQVGRVVRIGRVPVNFLLGAYYNPIRPDDGPTWQLRTQATVIF